MSDLREFQYKNENKSYTINKNKTIFLSSAHFPDKTFNAFTYNYELYNDKPRNIPTSEINTLTNLNSPTVNKRFNKQLKKKTLGIKNKKENHTSCPSH